MKTISKVSVENLVCHPYHEKVYVSNSQENLEVSFKRTENEPVYPIVVVPNPELPDLYWVVSGMNRLNTLIQMDQTEVEVIVKDISDETQIKNLIVDLNKQRIKTGRELLMEFRHYLEMYPDQRGGKGGSRYSKIGKEMGRSKDRVKNFVMLNNFFEGEGDVVMESIFGGGLSVHQGMTLKKVVEQFPEKFDSESSFGKLCDSSFDFNRLESSLVHTSLDDELEFTLVKEYLTKNINQSEFEDCLEQMGKTIKRITIHNESKIEVPEVDESYVSKNVCLIKGDNRKVDFVHPFDKPINCIVGSPPYGDLRLNGDDPDTDTGHNMTGSEYGVYLSETYSRYKPYMSPDGSIYVIIDDYRKPDGSLSLSIEHFVVEMERKGFYLIGRYTWSKTNPQPRGYDVKTMVNGFEMVYRFVLDPQNCYFNQGMFLEMEQQECRFNHGCTNTDNKGNTTRGGIYFQSHLKKLRNTLDENSCLDIIRGNVSNPLDYFRQEREKKHTSTSPMYLTSVLILESTKPEDLVVDIWNGVGNTMESSLLLQRNYVGIEKEEGYFKQSQRRLQMISESLEEIDEVEEVSTVTPHLPQYNIAC